MHYNFSQLLKGKLEKEMAGILADNVEEEYLWATSLNSANKVQPFQSSRVLISCPAVVKHLFSTLGTQDSSKLRQGIVAG